MHALRSTNRHDVPAQIIPQDELLPPGTLLPPQHEGLVSSLIVQIALGGNPQVLVHVRSTPGVIVGYVGMKRLARPGEGEQVRGIEVCGDMGE